MGNYSFRCEDFPPKYLVTMGLGEYIYTHTYKHTYTYEKDLDMTSNFKKDTYLCYSLKI